MIGRGRKGDGKGDQDKIEGTKKKTFLHLGGESLILYPADEHLKGKLKRTLLPEKGEGKNGESIREKRWGARSLVARRQTRVSDK